MTTIAKLQNLTTPVEINWSLMRDEKAVFTFECEPEPEIESESESEETDFTTDVLQFQLDLMMKLKNKEITHEEGMKMLKETYPTVVSDDEEEEEEEEEEEYSCDNCGHQCNNEEEWAGCCDEHSCVNCECDCSECAEEEVRPTHNQLVALGKYKLAKYQIKKQEEYCEICDVSKGDEGCDCRIIECARCGEKGPKYNHNLGSDGLLRCDVCVDAPADSCSQCGIELGEDVHIFCFSKGDDETTMCSNCADELTDEMRANGWTRDDDSDSD